MCVSGHNFQQDFEELFGGQFENVNAHGLYMTFKGLTKKNEFIEQRTCPGFHHLGHLSQPYCITS